MRGQASVEYILLLAVSVILAIIVVLGFTAFYGILSDLSSFLKDYTKNMGVDLRAAKIL